jgi:fatty-acyl-CoA synthase
VRGDDVAVLQFTSGSTSAPKGAEITHGALLTERRGSIVAQGFSDADRMAGWLPYFHDAGLIVFMIHPTAFGITAHVLPTERFARDPAELMRLIDRFDLTFTAGPPSAFWVSFRAADRAKEGIGLRSLRAVGLGAETIDPVLMKKIFETGEHLGMRAEAPFGSYGLAEAVACVSSSPHDLRLRIDQVDLDEFARSGRAMPGGTRQKEIVSCGFPHPGVEIRIVGPDGDASERAIGEVLLRSPAMMRGYVGDDVEDPFVDGWLRTGDLGYMADGELFVTGRTKDVVIVSGQNYSAEDFEWAAMRVDGVRGGRCAAFARPDEESVVLVLEPIEGADAQDLAVRVRNGVTDIVGRVPMDVVVVAPGAIHKTTSGKLRRGAVRAAHANGELTPLATARGARLGQ